MSNKYVTVIEKDEKYDIPRKVKVDILGKVFVLDRANINGKDYSDYRKKILKGDIEDATQNLIIKCISEPKSYGVLDILNDDPLVYRCLSDAIKMFINLDDDFL